MLAGGLGTDSLVAFSINMHHQWTSSVAGTGSSGRNEANTANHQLVFLDVRGNGIKSIDKYENIVRSEYYRSGTGTVALKGVESLSQATR
jgi:hypothetical protein